MLGFAAGKLGIDIVFLDPSEEPPAASAGRVIRAPFDCANGLAQLAEASDVITYEFENISVTELRSIAAKIPVFPPPEALRIAQDRLYEKSLFEQLRIPVPDFLPVSDRHDLDRAVSALGFPFVLKTRTLGYDGKGQAVLRTASDLPAVWRSIGKVPLIAEQWVDFDYEVSVIGARNPGGECVVYPLTENRHRDGILRVSRATCRHAPMLDIAGEYLVRLLEHFDYVGVLALELFVDNGQLLANEFAPRVHNSGHWTIEGAATSQFENHIRAVLDLPLGDTSAVACAGMLNLIGTIPDEVRRAADFEFFLHDYGKSARAGRKLGHITLLADSEATRNARIAALENVLAT
jgi:5-(carboxyamino)imidazole ribonucleotide synthase